MRTCQPQLRLHGFNNLTKTLSFNLYHIAYVHSPTQRAAYFSYIKENYNAEHLTQVLSVVAEIIDANILNIACQDYEPQGASVSILLSENEDDLLDMSASYSGETVLAHLDKSHLTVHTYPENHPHNGIHTFRIDIDISTCGRISPLQALNYLIHDFSADVVVMDYRVRGFTRDVKGKKHYIDHTINSIQNFLSPQAKRYYSMIDSNFPQEKNFHTRMMLREIDVNKHLFELEKADCCMSDLSRIEGFLYKEIREIFYGQNIGAG